MNTPLTWECLENVLEGLVKIGSCVLVEIGISNVMSVIV